MPTYEYACETCGIVEALQSMRDAPLKKCPQCGRAGVTRLISGGGGVIFKGSGFWETDYNRSSDYQKKTKEETGKTAKPKAPAESTPAPAPEAKPQPAAAPTPGKPAGPATPT